MWHACGARRVHRFGETWEDLGVHRRVIHRY